MTLHITMLPVLAGLTEPTGWISSDWMAVVLVALVFLVIGLGIFCRFIVMRLLRLERGTSSLGWRDAANLPAEGRKFHPSMFEIPSRWLAIKSNNLQIVQSALCMHNPIPCSWEEGMSRAQRQKLFITPPINGWILAVGASLPDPHEDVDESFHLIVDLSRKLGEVQFFSTNRILHHHAWVKADQGRIRRAYAWAGTTLWNEGPKTHAEIALGLKCFDYCQEQPRMFAAHELLRANTEKVPLLAARWSIDPTAINTARIERSRGIAGEFSF
jgi:hypothetical protein